MNQFYESFYAKAVKLYNMQIGYRCWHFLMWSDIFHFHYAMLLNVSFKGRSNLIRFYRILHISSHCQCISLPISADTRTHFIIGSYAV